MISRFNSNDATVRLDQSAFRLIKNHELPINLLIRHVANRAAFAKSFEVFPLELAKISFKSKNQHLKRDANRELLARFTNALTERIEYNTPLMFNNSQSSAQIDEYRFKRNTVTSEGCLSFNRILKDLLDPKI